MVMKLIAQQLLIVVPLCLFFCLAHGASFIVERSQVRVKGDGFSAAYPSGIGDFGIPNYGAILIGQLAFVPENAAGCSDFFTALPPGTDVVLVDRGSCFFVEKSMHAQTSGAKAIIVTNNIPGEDLLTMAVPENRPELAPLLAQLIIPTVLITKEAGDEIKAALQRSRVTVELDWSESITHGNRVVDWEFWFTTNDACGEVCTAQQSFLKAFKGPSASLEQQGYTRFTPHVMLKTCEWWGGGGVDCARDCIRNGRYCSIEPIPDDLRAQYTGADVVEMNLRHLCAFQVANQSSSGGGGSGTAAWWNFAAAFADVCHMRSTNTFTPGCAQQQLTAAGIDPGEVEKCVGARNADAPHAIFEEQIRAQTDVEYTGRGRVIMLPTVVINFDQYRGSLSAAGVLRGLCAGFAEGSEPPACLSGGLEVDECSAGTHHCWTNPELGLSACRDTFRGYVCRCPSGWEGDGERCIDVDECSLGISGCDQICVNTPGSYHCDCTAGYTLHGGLGGPGICLPNALEDGKNSISNLPRLPVWLVVLLFCACVASVSVAGGVYYRQRMKREMQGEIRSIMREYMPLPDGEGDAAAATASEEGQGGWSSGHRLFGGRRGQTAARAPVGGFEDDAYKASVVVGSQHGDTQMATFGGGGGGRES